MTPTNPQTNPCYRRIAVACLAVLLAVRIAQAQTTPLYPQYPSETPATFKPPTYGMDYERRDVMIAMRDGVKLHTIIYTPKSHTGPLPILFNRTPYGIDGTYRAFPSGLSKS